MELKHGEMVVIGARYFSAQKGHEWMTVTFSKVVLYSNGIQ